MNKLFHSDGIIGRFFSAVGDLILLNLLLLLSSLPLVTIGPAICAALQVLILHSEGKESGMIEPFLRMFRKNFCLTIPTWLGFLGVLILLIMQYFLIASLERNMIWATLLCIWALAFGLIFSSAFYFLFLAGRYDNRVQTHLKNAFLLSVGNIPRTLTLLAVNLCPFLLLLFAPAVFFYLIPFWMLFAFALLLKIDIWILKPTVQVLDQLSSKKETNE